MIELKKQIKEISLNEGVIQNTLFSCEHMKRGKHHLFDELDNGGLKVEESNSNFEEEFYKSMKAHKTHKLKL